MVRRSSLFAEDGSHLYRFAFLAAKELLLTARKWRNDIERVGPRQVDLSEADRALGGAIRSLEIALAPPVADGVFVDPRDNPDWGDLPSVEQVNISQQLIESRDETFSAFGLSGLSAHEVILELGEATQRAMVFLAQARDEQLLDRLLAPDSPLRTETRGLGEISATEAERVEAECLREAERAWAAAKAQAAAPTHSERQPSARSGTKRATVNTRMLETIHKMPEAMGWTTSQWAKYLKCAKSSVAEAQVWKDLAMGRERKKAERAKDRRRKPKASDRGHD